MRILQNHLCLRFRPIDGWTREAVRQLLKRDARLARVCPRYYGERDKANGRGFEVDDGLPHDDCEYFAVYGGLDVREHFDEQLLSQHEIC